MASRRTLGSPRGSDRSPADGAEAEVIADMFSTVLRNIVGNQYHANNRPLANPGDPDPDADSMLPNLFGPAGGRLNPRNADSSQAGDTQVPDIHT